MASPRNATAPSHRSRGAYLAVLLGTAVVAGFAALPARAQGWTPPPPTYRLHDSAGGRVMSILPPGENGLVSASDLSAFEANGTRPAGSQDQLGPYASLLYHAQGLTDAQ